MRCGVTSQNLNAGRLEVGDRAGAGIAPRYRNTANVEKLRQRAHSRAGNANEVDGTRVCGVEK
jgi:hypothetical protein